MAQSRRHHATRRPRFGSKSAVRDESLQHVVGELRKSRLALKTLAKEIPRSSRGLASMKNPREIEVLMVRALGEVQVLRRSVDAVTREMFTLSGKARTMANSLSVA